MLKQFLHRLIKLQEYLFRLTLGQLKGPSVLVVELTNNCNANCLMCGRESMSRKRMYMKFDLFQEIILDAKNKGIKTIQLSFYGEPLLFPKLVDAVRFIKEEMSDVVIVANTNGALLTRKLAKDLLDAGLSLFSISIDGSNKTEFEKIRVGLKWNDVRKNVKDLNALITTHNYPARVHIRGLNLKNYSIDINEYNRLWVPYANQVMIRNDHDTCRSQKESIMHQLFPCDKIFSQIVIMVNGEATICAYDWEGESSYGKFPDKSIKQLWRTPILIKKRLTHFFGMKKSINFCRDCTYRAFNF